MKPQHGGKRPGAGRKPDANAPRILITAKILPETHERLERERKKEKLSRGKFIDRLLERRNDES